MNQWLKVSVLTGATVLAGTLYFSGISWAQTTTITSTTSTTSTAPAVVDAAPRLWGKQGLFTREERSAMIAEALGMTPAELQKAQKDGTNLRQLAAARGLDRKTLMDSLRAAMEKL
jgi:lambda repressor-like predicted transcriptional regulator